MNKYEKKEKEITNVKHILNSRKQSPSCSTVTLY